MQYAGNGNYNGALSVAKTNSYGVSIDEENNIIYIADYQNNEIRQIGYPSIQNSTSIQSEYSLNFEINGFGFCDRSDSLECNQISLFQNSTQVQNIYISILSSTFNNLHSSNSTFAFPARFELSF